MNLSPKVLERSRVRDSHFLIRFRSATVRSYENCTPPSHQTRILTGNGGLQLPLAVSQGIELGILFQKLEKELGSQMIFLLLDIALLPCIAMKIAYYQIVKIIFFDATETKRTIIE